jgi:hypothetical protein
MQDAVSDVDGIDPSRSMLQQAVAESARRGTHIGTYPIPDRHREGRKRGLQLLSAAGDVLRPLIHQDLGIRRDAAGWPEDGLATDPDVTGHHQTLGQGPALG